MSNDSGEKEKTMKKIEENWGLIEETLKIRLRSLKEYKRMSGHVGASGENKKENIRGYWDGKIEVLEDILSE